MTFGLLLEQRGLTPRILKAPDVYCVLGGEKERLSAFADIHQIRANGHTVEYPFKDIAFGKQLKAAVDSGAQFALIYGSEELAKGVVKLRNLRDKSEREIARENVLHEVTHVLAGE